jgi:hypothetical protein
MRSIQSQYTFPLSAVKPLDGLLRYREHCLSATRAALGGGRRRREHSPVTGALLESYGEVEGLAYARCPESGSVFLVELPVPEAWGRLLCEVSGYRHSPEAFHAGLARSRADHVYAPKLEWIEDALRLQGLRSPALLEVVTAPSDFSALLRESGSFADVLTVDETELATAPKRLSGDRLVDAAVLLESLDRAHDPEALLRVVAERLVEGGLLFVTDLVASGFDLAVLGLRSLYLYPPDRANCFSLEGLCTLLRRAGFGLLEVSTPGVLDIEIVRAHLRRDPTLPVSAFERQVLDADDDTRQAFQAFLQQQSLSSFARIVARKPG